MQENQLLQLMSLLKAPQVELKPEDYSLLAALPSLRLKVESRGLLHLAEDILQLLRAHIGYQALSRACIAKKLGLSNQLVIISSQEINQSENRMGPGYDCFVTPNSTLLQMSGSHIRTYGNSQKIVESFKNDHTPPQKTIARLAEGGHVSGISIPIPVDGKIWGFIFLNGSEPSFSQLRPFDFALYAHLQAILSLIIGGLERLSPSYFRIASQAKGEYAAQILSADMLRKSLEKHLELLQIKPEIQVFCDTDRRFLVSLGNICNVLARLIFKCDWQSVSIYVKNYEHRLRLEIYYYGGYSPANRRLMLEDSFYDLKFLGQSPHIADQTISIDLQGEFYDEESKVLYSVDMPH